MPLSTPIDTIGAPLVAHDLQILKTKGATYGDSWKKRGGVDTYFMLCRKWDRIENMVEEVSDGIGPNPNSDYPSATRYNILERASLPTAYTQTDGDPPDGTLLAEIRDLRRYLLLVDIELTKRARDHHHDHNAANDAYQQHATDAMQGSTLPEPKAPEWEHSQFCKCSVCDPPHGHE